MAKDFGRVNRDIHIVKLENIVVSDNMLESITSLYADCRAAVGNAVLTHLRICSRKYGVSGIA